MIPEVEQLNQIRLDEDLTLEELAGEIGDVDASTLSRLFDKPDYKPFDRTVHKIQRFLDRRRRSSKKPARGLRA